MDIIFYDLEVFKYDWTVTFKSLRTGEYWFYHNDNNGVRDFMRKKNIILCGFNNKMYDDYILLAIMVGADNYTLKKLNDWIIEDKKLPWEFPFLQGHWKNFDSFDLRDDLYMGLSLKVIEGNLGMNIEESSIPFDIDRPLTDKEIEEIRLYNKADVDATERLFHERKRNYLKPKVDVGRLIGLNDAESLRMTNAKLTAQILKANKIPRDDERNYVPPKVINWERIPKAIRDFYSRMYDESISDEELFKGEVYNPKTKKYEKPKQIFTDEKGNKTHMYYSGKLTIFQPDMDYVYAWGGVHAGIPNYIEESTDDRIILLWDVNSLYPSIMIQYNFLSRNVPNPEEFKEIYDERMKAKAEGNKAVSDSRKLILNTTYGAMLNECNDLYDPLMGRSVCITGQLVMTDLLFGLKAECESFKPINFNTDGILFSIDRNELNKAKEVAKEWENRTGLTLGEDRIKKIVQKDVNNYCMLLENGEVVTTGAMVGNYGGGDINNNSLVVVHNALVNYLLFNKPVEDTINEETNILNFQMIARTGNTYLKTYHTINGERVEVQNVNRVYATKDKRYGTIHKFKLNKDGTERYDKIANLPEHCIIDNRNELSIEDIDKDFYIEMAKKRIEQFIGKK